MAERYWHTCPHLSAVSLAVDFIFERHDIVGGVCGAASIGYLSS